MAVQDFFTWGAGGQKLTPGELARRREIEDALLAKGPDFSPVGHWTQGLARVADAAAGAFRRNRLGKAEGENAEVNKGLIANLLAGGSSAPSSGSSIPMSEAGAEVSATSPTTQPIDLSGNEVYSQFIGAAREGGLTNPYGLAALAATGKAESGFSPGNVNRTWSDPSQSGQPGTAGGILSWRGPRYQALAATGDLSPAGQARFFLQEDPGLVQALNNAKSVEEAQSLINNAWKFAGYDQAGGETARRLGLARSFLPTFQGGGEVAAATPEAAIEAIAPLQPVELGPLQSYAGQERAAPVSLSEEVAAYQQTPEYAAAFPGRQQPTTSAQPVQVAGGGDRVPMASSSTGINPAIIEALTNPQASEQTQRIAGILLQQDQARQNAALDEQNWRARQAYEQELLAQDPLRMAQIEKLQRENAQPPGSDETFYGNPVAVQNADGSVSYGQIGNRGTFRPIQLGEGQTFAPPTRTINTGTEIIQADQAGNVISRTPINNREAASERAAGTEEGQTRVQREMAAPAEIQAGQNALALLDNIRNDPYLARGTGGTSLFNRIPGTGGYDFSNKVEQAKSGAFLTAIQQMRGLGALSNAEGSAATAAITRMDTATSEEAFKAALDDYEKIVRQGIERAQSRIGGASSAPAAKGSIGGNRTSTGVQWSVE